MSSVSVRRLRTSGRAEGERGVRSRLRVERRAARWGAPGLNIPSSARFFAFASFALFDISFFLDIGIAAKKKRSEKNAPRSGWRDNRLNRCDAPQKVAVSFEGLVQIHLRTVARRARFGPPYVP